MVDVDITWGGVIIGAEAAKLRTINGIRRCESRYGKVKGLGLDIDWRGVLGELALAQHLDRYWNPQIGRYDLPDVGKRHQSRASQEGWNHMFLHPEDKDDDVFVNALVTRERLPVITLRGWMYGRDGKLEKYWRANAERPAFFVEPEGLEDMDDLPRDRGR